MGEPDAGGPASLGHDGGDGRDRRGIGADGECEQVALSCSARHRAELLLDEPTSALDLAHTHVVMSVVRELARERGVIAIAVLHDIALATQFADRVVVLGDGALIADGAPDKAIAPETLRAAYGVVARVERCSLGRLMVAVDGTAGP